MTILAGILCKDGVVGSDSSSTFASGQVRTIEQKIKKVDIIDKDIIVACTGQVGLAQRVNGVVETKLKGNHYKNKSHIETAKNICSACIADFSSTSAPKGQCGALIAFATSTTPHLCEFDVNTFQPEFKTEKLWYVSMGSGQPIADPFLGFIRKIFWKDSLPLLKDGIFAVTWTLLHAIELNPGGINGPPQIATLSKDNKGQYIAMLLGDEELSEHIENVVAAEKYFSDYRSIMQGISKEKIPEPK